MNQNDKLKQQKLKKYEERFNNLLAEMGEDLLTKAELTKLEKKLRSMFSEKGVTFQLSTLKAFEQGARFIIGAMQHDKDLPQSMLLALSTMIKHKESDLDTFISTATVSEDTDAKKETDKEDGDGRTDEVASSDEGATAKGNGGKKEEKDAK